MEKELSPIEILKYYKNFTIKELFDENRKNLIKVFSNRKVILAKYLFGINAEGIAPIDFMEEVTIKDLSELSVDEITVDDLFVEDVRQLLPEGMVIEDVEVFLSKALAYDYLINENNKLTSEYMDKLGKSSQTYLVDNVIKKEQYIKTMERGVILD